MSRIRHAAFRNPVHYTCVSVFSLLCPAARGRPLLSHGFKGAQWPNDSFLAFNCDLIFPFMLIQSCVKLYPHKLLWITNLFLWTLSIDAHVREGEHLLYLSISGSWTHQVGLISETFCWDVSQLGPRSEAVIVYWFRLGCSVQFWELLLQSTDCNDGEPSMWQHWLHQPASVSTFHLRYLFVFSAP